MTKLFIFCTLKSLNLFPLLPQSSSSRGKHPKVTHSMKMWWSYWQKELVLFNLNEVFGEERDTQTPFIVLFIADNRWQHSQIIIFISLHMLISHKLAWYLINSLVIRIFTCIYSAWDRILKSSRFSEIPDPVGGVWRCGWWQRVGDRSRQESFQGSQCWSFPVSWYKAQDTHFSRVQLLIPGVDTAVFHILWFQDDRKRKKCKKPTATYGQN